MSRPSMSAVRSSFPKDSPNMRSKFTYLAMMRAAKAKVLPEDIDMVLSLDCDTIIHGSLDELWDLDLDGYYFLCK